ncbi:MAG: glutamine--fructose-6-phosphate transaminase (isomerizing) [Bacilli bacterium]|nr:glutamine--fructose-6-phosphate transaminase (isomerizing) [Bacilli bacterium]
MCGIVGYIGKDKNTLRNLINSLKILEYRGYDSAGIAYVKNKTVKIIKEKGKIEALEKKINFNEDVTIGMGHTRWATHGEPSIVNSHPHKVGKITLVHNGIIENYEELKKLLKEFGYKFKSDTDTEVVCALIDKLYNEKKDLKKVLSKLVNLIKGSYAFSIISDDEPDTIYAIRKDSPLILALSNNGYYIASDVPAILNHTNKYILIDNDEIIELKKDNYFIYNSRLEPIQKKVSIFEGSINSSIKDGYSHFMLKEIHEEDKVIKDTMFPYIENGISSLIDKMPDLKKYENIDIVACGSAYHAGLIGKTLIEDYAKIPVNVEIASEYRYKTLFSNSKNLVILVSQSGETADTLSSLRIAKENNIDTLAIVNVVGSSIAREAKEVLYIKAGYEIAVATTKAYLAQIAMFSLIALNLGYINNLINDNQIEDIFNQIYKLPKLIKEVLNEDYSKIAKKIYKEKDIFFIGRKIDYPIAMEGSLKLKEIAYIHSEAYAAGELKHGTISLIQKNTPIIAIATDKNVFSKTISNIKEVKARGAYIIYLTTSNLNNELDFADTKIIIPQTSPLLQTILAIIPLQLIAFETAKLKGCDIDKPRNLAKSVTVE